VEEGDSVMIAHVKRLILVSWNGSGLAGEELVVKED
jgi:hypothetical protein